jgi:hypothetical protein
VSTDLSAELRTSTGDQPAFSPLLGNMLVIMSADSTFGKLADTLAANQKRTDVSLDQTPQNANPRAHIKFHTYDGEEQLSLTLTHSEERNLLLIRVQTPSGSQERVDIGQHIASILKNATNGQIDMSDLKRAISNNASSTNTRPIDALKSTHIPDGLNEALFPKAQEIARRHDGAKQTYVNALNSILEKMRASQGGKDNGFKPKT